MSELGEYWRDVKEHYRGKQRNYEQRIAPDIQKLINHPECKKVGTQWRIRDWDFWWTGMVINWRTKEHISIKELQQLLTNH